MTERHSPTTGAREPGRRPGLVRLAIALVALIAAVAAGVALVEQRSSSRPARELASIFEDDKLLIYQPLTAAGDAEVQRTLLTLKALGADRLRLIIEWAYIAPPVRGRGFDATDPADYSAALWAPYDRVVRLARADDLAVYFDVTAPGPLWAMHSGGGTRYGDHYEPSARAFQAFVQAVGRRYDGRYGGPPGPGAPSGGRLPRISFWSFWNEPNQPGWLAPQYTRGGQPESPRLYRALVDAGYRGLAQTGHRHDTILIGETAPEGVETHGQEDPMTPVPFLQALYCVNAADEPLSGAGARAVGCPAAESRSRFVAANPGLFQISGYAHHPYAFFVAPEVRYSDPNFVSLADLGTLTSELDRIFTVSGVDRRLPIWLTEYGYQTSPPRTRPPLTTLRQQSLYLDEAEYLAWGNPRVRSLAQFELRDSPPDPAFPPGSVGYWSTFQTGLEFLDGKPKPAQAAYRLPIFVPQVTARRGTPLLVWGMLRLAPNGTSQHAVLQWRPTGSPTYRTIGKVGTRDPSGFLELRVIPPGTGVIRLSWSPRQGPTVYSRGVGVTVSGG